LRLPGKTQFAIDAGMIVRICLFIFATCLWTGAAAAQAPTAVAEPFEIGPSGEAYLRSVRFRRIKTGVGYFDPTAPAPELATRQEPTKAAKDNDTVTRQPPNLIVVVISAALLGGVAWVFFRFGSGVSVSWRRDAENAQSTRTGRGGGVRAGAAQPRSLQAIIDMQDRRDALVALAQNALARAITANGVLMQRSWTAREALRQLPARQAHLEALKALIGDSERVHFGGRDISEGEFHAHVNNMRPFFDEVSA